MIVAIAIFVLKADFYSPQNTSAYPVSTLGRDLRVEHGCQHQLLIGAQACPSKANRHWIVGGIFEILQDIFSLCCVLAHHIHSIDRQDCVTHWEIRRKWSENAA